MDLTTILVVFVFVGACLPLGYVLIYNPVQGMLRARQQRNRRRGGSVNTRLALVQSMALEYITPEYISSERNAEVRNALIRRVGIDTYMKSVKAQLYSKDDYGEYYTYSSGNGSTLAAIKVLNSTPESDGTFKDFWLRVPARGVAQPERFCTICGRNIAVDIDIPKQGIAWTFRLCEHHYHPEYMS